MTQYKLIELLCDADINMKYKHLRTTITLQEVMDRYEKNKHRII